MTVYSLAETTVGCPPDYNCDRPLKPISTTKTRSLSQQGNKTLFTVNSIEKSSKRPNKLCRQKTIAFVCCAVKVREKYFKTKKIYRAALHTILCQYYNSSTRETSVAKKNAKSQQTTYFGILFKKRI
jgi:hypothetical protein